MEIALRILPLAEEITGCSKCGWAIKQKVQIGKALESRGLHVRVYWRKVRWGQNLILSDEDGHEQEVGGFRKTKRGIDALAKTFGYDPSHSRKGFQTIEEAKAFVESFRPWELYGAQDVTVESEVMPALDSASADTTVAPDQPAKSMVPELQPTKRWWEFWKKT